MLIHLETLNKVRIFKYNKKIIEKVKKLNRGESAINRNDRL
jgi:hypothetical protein